MALRKRIGVMVPSTNTTFEADFQLVSPRDVTIHGQRLWLTNDAEGQAGMDRMNGEIEAGAKYLATANVDVIAYGCTTGSFYRGPGYDREMLDTIQKTAGVPAVAAAPAVVEALRHFGARRVSVATPYPDWNNARLTLKTSWARSLTNMAPKASGSWLGGSAHFVIKSALTVVISAPWYPGVQSLHLISSP